MSSKYHMELESSRSFKSKSSSPTEVRLIIGNVPFTLHRELLSARSAKLASLFEENKVSYVLRDIPADPETFELVARFCHGFDPQLSAENILPLICLASHLGMTEDHCNNNLLREALDFFENKTLPSWNETIRALLLSDRVIPPAASLGLIDACLESITAKAIMDPRLLGKPIKNLRSDGCSEEVDEEDECKPNARRKLFVHDWQSEDLTTLPVHFYEPIIEAMKLHGVPLDYVAASLCEYARRWVFNGFSEGEETKFSVYKKNSPREAIEVIERLLPEERGLIQCPLLFEMLRYSISLEASSNCRDGLEVRIAQQLDQATVKDLRIPFKGYAKGAKYDIGCVKRILKNFYGRVTGSGALGITRVADLIEDFLAEVAADVDLEMNTFVSLAEMSVAASLGSDRSSDGIYKAIDIYLDKHRYLTESEREEVCRVLDCQKMSQEACEHAAQNERLPLRVVVQVLFIEQLKLRDAVTKEVSSGIENRSRNESEEEEGDGIVTCREEELRGEMMRMNNKVVELERECGIMRKEIENNGNRRGATKKHKLSVWGEIKRKFGCISSAHDYKCQVQKKKKVHPRHGE
ncbi:BTB/POZ domain-containing protein At5g17580-like [Punica granatum]|uniref:BTB/POZ domain-containing protein At5g17580-like n=1 Tax=Punica granatum TaxID=22663 RepID=A0A6P8DUA0_PUNGR|nr:BTB/POZ domain-containing protein At5g17580-like [Punica granatum]